MKKNILASAVCVAIFCSSCSISGKINRSAKEGILKNESFSSAHTGISVYEPATGKFWYNYQGEKYFIPASNTKIFSCYAAMKYLGDSLVGVKYENINDSAVIIQGMGDPTFGYDGFSVNPVLKFLKKYKEVKIKRPSFDNYLGNGWSWGDYKQGYMAQRSAFPIYGNVLKVQWINQDELEFYPSYFERNAVITEKMPKGFRVDKSWDLNDFSFSAGRRTSVEIPFRPYDTTLLHLLQDTLNGKVTLVGTNQKLNKVIHSRLTDDYLRPMMHHSNNFFAEQSLLMVSQQLLGYMNVRKIIDTLLKTDFKALPQEASWADGSGLSRYNLFTPKDIVFTLNKMKDTFGMERIKNILPTGGEGTITKYYKEDSGYIYVKTGTLNGVVALSGFLYTKKNKLLVFSVLVNNHNSTATKIREGIEVFIQKLRNKY